MGKQLTFQPHPNPTGVPNLMPRPSKAGATAHSISPPPLWQFGNVIKCNPRSHPLCYWTCDNCSPQAKKLENCKLLLGNPCTSSYSYSCSGRGAPAVVGATAHSISLRAMWRFRNGFQCTNSFLIPLQSTTTIAATVDLGTQDQGYTQVMHVKSCKFLLDNPYTSSYNIHALGMMSPAGVGLPSRNTDSAWPSKKTMPVRTYFICNSYHQATICFSKAPYIKKYRGHQFAQPSALPPQSHPYSCSKAKTSAPKVRPGEQQVQLEVL
ncbi:hypothetical protein U0070_015991 [Myodes glareolus]|uniref:Xylanase inhibitor N-terminal domain-containing protein n=1 Tax=Myodes glareolus TaxID=447135 RepID=A0AAW0GYF0_MYOGA